MNYTTPTQPDGIKVKQGAEGTYFERELSDEEYLCRILNKFNTHANKCKTADEELAMRVAATRDYLRGVSELMRKSWIDWMDGAGKRLVEIRQLRLALEDESRRTLAACRDVRHFINEEGHEQEVAKLERFVGLCERLRAVQKDGTLDAVVDCILKLEVR